MAENKGILVVKSAQKYAGRAKEKLLQNLGKVDRTADEIFDEHLANFQLQQNSANRLQKEFNNYIRCVRAVQVASKTLMEAVSEVYESQWTGADALYAQASNIEVLWQDFSHKLGDQVLIPLNTYTAQFPEMKKKIDKRGRKLVDYDSQRHSFQNLQANAAKRKDDVKLTKGREQLEEAKHTYELLNTELHDELPALYDSRILFLVTNLQTLFASEQMFHSEISKIYAELEAVVDKLATESQRGSYTFKKPPITSNSTSQQSPVKTIANNTAAKVYPAPATNGTAVTNGASSPSPTSSNSPTSFEMRSHQQDDEQQYQNQELTAPIEPPYQNTASLISNNNNNNKTDDGFVIGAGTKMESSANNNNTESINNIKESSTTTATDTKLQSNNNINSNNHTIVDTFNNNNNNHNNSNNLEELYDIPVGATTTDLPDGVLYRVKATYKYNREDTDELSFDVGDIIRVVEYEDPEDQEEGWLMGTKEGTDEKGMFPANFTRPI